MDKLILRDYQQRVVGDFQEVWMEHRAAVTWIPTGTDTTEVSVLDRVVDVLRHRKVEDFDSHDLSENDSRSDRKTPSQSSDYPCPECRAVMSPGQRACHECGHELTRTNVEHFEPFELVEDGQVHKEMTRDDYRDLYLELRGLHEAGGQDSASAARKAYAQLHGNLEFKAPYSWRSMPSRPPSTRTIDLDTSWSIRWAKSQDKTKQPTGCKRCGSTSTRTGPGKGPHAASLVCASCNSFLRWIPKAEAARVLA